MPSRARLTALVLSLPVLAGCEEEQAAVPLSTSLPTALLLLAGMVLVLGGGWRWFERINLGRDASRDRPHPVRRLLVVYPAAIAGVLVVWTSLWIFGVAFAYREPTYSLFSWTDTVWIAAIMLAITAPIALLHLRMISALWRGRRWADVVLGLQAGLALVWGLGTLSA